MSRPDPSRLHVIGLTAVFATFFVAAGAPTPLLALQQRSWGFSAGLLTVAFSVYAFALLAALLAGGSLSDHLGRRPVLLAAVIGELVSMLVFVAAPDIGWIVVARAIQGFATGLATSAFSVAIVEQAPVGLRPLAGSLAAASVAVGLGTGALVAGAVVQLTPDATRVVFLVLAATMVPALVLVGRLEETGVRRPGALASLVPRLSTPRQVGDEFWAGVPAIVATWMFAAFFLGLGPAVLGAQLGTTDGLTVGFTTFLAPFTAGVSTFAFLRRGPRRSILAGLVATLVGMVTVLAALAIASLPLLWAGAVVGGFGFGGAFGGEVRLMAPRAPAHERATLVAGIYTVAYLAVGVPVVVAGQLVPRWGLAATYQGYAALVVALAGLGIALHASRARRDGVPTRDHHEHHATPGAAGSRG